MKTVGIFTTMENRKKIKEQLEKATSNRMGLLDKVLQSYLLIFLAVLSVGGLGYILFKEIKYISASTACPGELQTPITGLVELDANDFALDNVIDCSAVDIEIQDGGILRILPKISDNDSDSDDFGLVIQANSFTIDSGGLLDLEGQGYGPSQQSAHIGSGKSSNTPETCQGGSCGGSGGGHGGAGGKGDPDFEQEAGLAGNIYGEKEFPITLGSGGGESAREAEGGSGGGAVKLQVSGTFTHNGSINGNGTNGLIQTDTGAGGGAGGSVWIEAASFAGEGIVTAGGGNGGDASQHGGGGGGGRIVMLCTEGNTYSGTVTVQDGIGGIQDGQVGTLVGPTCYPNDPENLQQYEDDGITAISAGGKTKDATIIFKFDVSDVDYPSTLRPQVEVRNQGTPFTGIATHTGATVDYAGGDAVEAVVTAYSLPKSAPYHWRARVIDDKGARSEWVEFDADPSEDFIVLGDPYKFVMIQGDGQNGTVGQALAQKTAVEIRDISDYTIPSVAFNWNVNSGGGSIQECGCTNYYATTNVDGYSEVTFILGIVAGTNNNKIQAVKKYLIGSPMEFIETALPDEITHYDIDVPSLALVNQSFSPIVLVQARDQYNNLVNTATNDVYFDAVNPDTHETFGDGNLLPDSSTLVDGEVTVANMTYDTLRNIRVKVWDDVDGVDHNESFSDIVSVVDALGDCFGRPNVPGTLTIDQSEIHNAADYPGGIINCSEVDVEIVEGTAATVITLNSYENGDAEYPSGDYGVTILANSFLVGPNAYLSADGTGYPATKGPGAGTSGSGYYPAGGGGSHGGKGGTGTNGPGSSGVPSGGAINDDVFEPVYLGSGGGEASTGAGGGAIKVIIDGINPSTNSDKLIVNGGIDADGANAGGNSGGGSGGSIWVQTNYLEGNGSIHADGGFGGDGGIAGQGAGGGGGRIAVEYEDKTGYTGIIYSHGGGYGTSNFSKNVGGPGTIYFEKIGVEDNEEGDLYVDNDGHNFLNAGIIEDSCPELPSPNHGGCKFDTITLGVDMDNDGNQGYGYVDFLGTGSALTLYTSTLTGDATSDLYAYGLAYIADDPYTLSLAGLHIKGDIVGYGFDIEDLDATITNQGELALYANTPWRSGDFTFSSITVNDTADLTLVSYDSQNYSDPDPWSDDYGVTLNLVNIQVDQGGEIMADSKGYPATRGPGYKGDTNGAGHGGYGGNSGYVYDSVYEPAQLGSGGGTGGGGGAVKLVVSNQMTVNGSIHSNGLNEGSGGSIWIDTNVLTGGVFGTNGDIFANGGTSSGTNGGGGGRVAVYYIDKSGFGGAAFSHGGGYGGPGTVYWEKKGVQNSKGGDLYVDNNNINQKHAGIIESNCLESAPPKYGCEFESITLGTDLDGNGSQGYGHLDFEGTNSKVTLTTTNALTGDGTSKMNVYGLMNFDFDPPTDPVVIELVDVGVYGDLSGVTDMTLQNEGRMTLNAWTGRRSERLVDPINRYIFDDVIVHDTGILTLLSYDDGNECNSIEDAGCYDDYGLDFYVDSLTINTGGLVSADGGGYGAGGYYTTNRGPGGGSNCDSFGACYGGAGTHGGYGQNNSTGVIYDDVYEPSMLGSSGGSLRNISTQNKWFGGLGGGAVYLDVTNTLLVDGQLTSNSILYSSMYPEQTRDHESGSGGSLLIDVKRVDGVGYIKANGRTETSSGGGGRIALYYEYNDGFNLDISEVSDYDHIQAYGNSGGAGTIYTEQKTKSMSPDYDGSLYVNNNGTNGLQAGLVEDDYLFDLIKLTEYGDLDVLGIDSSLTLTSGNAITGDGTSELRPFGLLVLPSDITIELVTVNIAGDLSGADTQLTLQNQGDLLLNGWTERRNEYSVSPINQYLFGDVDIAETSSLILRSYDNGNECNDINDAGCDDDYSPSVVADSLDIAIGGLVTADGEGYIGEKGPGAGYADGYYCNSPGGSYGGYSGDGRAGPGGKTIIPGSPYGSAYEPNLMGSGGGTDGASFAGGGGIKLSITSDLVLNGAISSDGEGGASCSGGGSGGGIWLDVGNLSGSGLITSDGGDITSGGACAGGGGSGGRISIEYSDNASFTGSARAYGGHSEDTRYAAPGTIYWEDKDGQADEGGDLYIDNNGNNGKQAAILEEYCLESEGGCAFETITIGIDLEGDTSHGYGDVDFLGVDSLLTLTGGNALTGDGTSELTSYGMLNLPSIVTLELATVNVNGDITGADDLTLQDSAGLVLNAHTQRRENESVDPINEFNFNSLDIGSNSTMQLNGYDDGDATYEVSDDYGIILNVSGDIEVGSTGEIAANYAGYNPNHGPGAGYGGTGYYPGGGGAYGGYGSDGNDGPASGTGYPGESYGSLYEPLEMGSGGGSDGGGMSGGGSIKISSLSGNFILNGVLSSDGEGHTDSCKGGGSGGGIWIMTDSFDGSGEISADGGSVGVGFGCQGGAGSGGRIAVYYNSSAFTGDMHAYGGLGVGTNYAGPGTIYEEDLANHETLTGNLLIDNNSVINGENGMNFLAQEYTFNDVMIGDNVEVKMLGDAGNNRSVEFNLNGDFTLSAGAVLEGNEQGYDTDSGQGAGEQGLGSSAGGGGGHGGAGGLGQDDGINPESDGGDTYGSSIQPLTIGSGGGTSGTSAAGGKGGSAVAIIAEDGTVELNGVVDVSGGDSEVVGDASGGGGAGGSVFLRACDIVVSATGVIDATGGDAPDAIFRGGGGGGGIIFLGHVCPDTITIDPLATITKAEGDGYQPGGEGIYGEYGIPDIYLQNQYRWRNGQEEELELGGEVEERSVKFKMNVADPDANDMLTPQIEIEDANEGNEFDGTNIFTGESVPWSGGSQPVLLEVIVQANGEEGSALNVNSNVLGISTDEFIWGEDYKWRGRVVDADGVPSAWVEFAENGDSTDFQVVSVPTCGNDVKEYGEECDGTDFGEESCVSRGYTGGDLTCTESCTIVEDCWECGNGVIEVGNNEQCDDGELGGFDCTYFDDFLGGVLGCDANCLYVTDECTSPPECGNSIVEAGEQCDDGNTENGDGCSSECEEEEIGGYCGDGVVQGGEGEDCDDGNTTNGDGCSNICLEEGDSYCGDGRTDVGEDCDDGNQVNGDGCSNVCSVEEGGYCGDGDLGTGEQCDDGNQISGDGCSNICTAEGDSGECGNGVVERGEQCDGNTGEKTCADFDSFTGGELYCNDECKFDTFNCTKNPVCGNGVIEPGEQCDGNEVGDLRCKDFYGYVGGDLNCNAECNYDMSNCVADGEAIVIAGLPITGSLKRVVVLGSGILSILLGVISLLLAFPSILVRRQKNPWGLVFDKSSNKPIAFAVIRLFEGKKKIDEKVSDLEGRYGFAVGEGDFELDVSQENFRRFKLSCKVTKTEGDVNRDIGLDPIKSKKFNLKTWVKNKLAYAREEFPKWSRYLYVVGFCFSIIATVISPIFYNFAVLGFYIILGLVYLFFAMRKGGKLYDAKSKEGIVGGFVRLFDATQNKLIDNQITDDGGRYMFIAEAGNYNLLAAKGGYKFPSKGQKDMKKTHYGSLVNVKKEKKGVLGIDLAMDPVNKKEMDLKRLRSRGKGVKFGSPFSA